MSHDVFVSYSSKDRQAADAACAILEAKGIRCWIAPRDIPPGENWAATIPGAIAAARVFLLIFSNNANASEQVGREVDIAANRRLTIIPFRIENTLPEKSLEYFLNTRHWLDAFTPPLEDHLNKLSEAIALILGKETPLTTMEPLPVRRWAFSPGGEGRSLGPYLIGAAALVSIAIGALAWAFLQRAPVPVVATTPTTIDASRNADIAMSSSARHAAPPKPTVIFARLQCATEADGAVKYCVTSVLGSQHDMAGRANTYGPQNLFDNNRATAWCEGVDGPGDGQEIAIHFAAPATIAGFSFVNGYAKSDDTFAKNNSVHGVTVLWPDGTQSALELEDQKEPFSLRLDAPKRDVRDVRLRIVSVNGGSKWPDTCISEIGVLPAE